MMEKTETGRVNLFGLPRTPLTEEFTSILAEGRGVRVEKIVSAGQTTGWCDQAETEFVSLLQGEAEIEYENGETVRLLKGDTLIINPRERHRVSFTTTEPPCVWLCVFYRRGD